MNSLRIIGKRMIFQFFMGIAKLTFVVSLSAAIGAVVFLWLCIHEPDCPGLEEEVIIFVNSISEKSHDLRPVASRH